MQDYGFRLREQFREVALPHQRSRFGGDGSGSGGVAQALVVRHKERLVAAVIELRDDHGAIQFKSELILAKRSLRLTHGIEEAAGIEPVVADEFEETAVQLLVPAFEIRLI